MVWGVGVMGVVWGVAVVGVGVGGVRAERKGVEMAADLAALAAAGRVVRGYEDGCLVAGRVAGWNGGVLDGCRTWGGPGEGVVVEVAVSRRVRGVFGALPLRARAVSRAGTIPVDGGMWTGAVAAGDGGFCRGSA
ncbi:Rv3654c family TadE-like protein [Actinocorallia sp. API 0066]|uniref:Rv3654c family TadE-like protein n=1 Tax=Actinocorallia sp. API 0066 TaxID=2896846 RepID=UPI0035ABF563